MPQSIRMDPISEGHPRTYTIKRNPILGYGFVAGSETPTMVKIVEPKGPSAGRLLPSDVIMAVNGINVETASRERIIKMIQLSDQQIEITVRQPSYEEIIRAKNLADPKFYTLNKSPGVNCYDPNGYRHQLDATSRPQPPALPPKISPLNRLVTSITQHYPQQSDSPSSQSTFGPAHDTTPPVQIKTYTTHPTALRQKTDNGTNKVDLSNGASKTLGRSLASYGRHSPIPQRCKSSLDMSNKKSAAADNGGDDGDSRLSMLKRSNTMRPIKHHAKVMEIFEVVIKIFFEDDSTRVLKYNQDTTVGAILDTLSSRLISNTHNANQIKSYFGLALTVGVNGESNLKEQASRRKLLHILDESDSIIKIRQLPYAPRLRLLCRMVYPPSDVNTLYAQDRVAFEYLYQQSCNDLRKERFSPELGQETALTLGALHLVEYVHSKHPKAHGNSRNPKVYIKLIKKTPGIRHFLPYSMIGSTLDKRGKCIVTQYKKLRARLSDQIRKNFETFDFEPPKATTNLNSYSTTSFHELYLPEIQNSSADYIKLIFLNHLSQLPCYGTPKRPVRTSISPIERNSAGDCTSSLDSVPWTSDSSPLIRSAHQSLQTYQNSPIDEHLKRVILMPPPPPSPPPAMFDSPRMAPMYQRPLNGSSTDQPILLPPHGGLLTQVLTDREIELLLVPPPPKMSN